MFYCNGSSRTYTYYVNESRCRAPLRKLQRDVARFTVSRVRTFQTLKRRLRWHAFDVSISQTPIISQARAARPPRPFSMRYFDSNNRDNEIGSLNRVTNQYYCSTALWPFDHGRTGLSQRCLSCGRYREKSITVAAILLYPTCGSR